MKDTVRNGLHKLQPGFGPAAPAKTASAEVYPHGAAHSNIAKEVAAKTFQDVNICYQCGKCSAGCPVRDYMSDAPNKVVRFVQLGLENSAFSSSTPWLCAGCLTCSTRCPNDFNLAKFMDAIREISIEKGVKTEEKEISSFHNAFLRQVRLFGRSYEAGLVADYKLNTLNLLQDVDSAPGMILKGKLSVLPHKVKDSKTIKNIFCKTSQKKKHNG